MYLGVEGGSCNFGPSADFSISVFWETSKTYCASSIPLLVEVLDGAAHENQLFLLRLRRKHLSLPNFQQTSLAVLADHATGPLPVLSRHPHLRRDYETSLLVDVCFLHLLASA